jgi:secretion/DNA translocation related CpaE-like protein
LVVDADPLGPGIDRVLGLEEQQGVRWADLAHTSGRLGARALREALPRQGRLGVLTWAASERRRLDPAVVREVLSAAARGHQTVVIDLPRNESAAELVPRCDQLIVVVNPTVTGIASTVRLVEGLTDGVRAGVVVRGPGTDPETVARAVGLPVIAEMSHQRGLAEAIDLGLGPLRSRRGPLAKAAHAALGRCVLQAVA